MEEQINKIKTSQDKNAFIELLKKVEDYECDARHGNATTEERKHIYRVLKELRDKIDNKVRQEVKPTTYE